MAAQPKGTVHPNRRLTTKAQRFVAEYLRDSNGTQAAIRAGYSPHTARNQASQMLSNVKVRQAVQEGFDRLFRSCEISAERTMRQLANVAFFDPARLFDDTGRVLPLGSMPPEIRNALETVTFESRSGGSGTDCTVVQRTRFGGRLAATVALAKHFSLFTFLDSGRWARHLKLESDCANMAAEEGEPFEDEDETSVDDRPGAESDSD